MNMQNKQINESYQKMIKENSDVKEKVSNLLIKALENTQDELKNVLEEANVLSALNVAEGLILDLTEDIKNTVDHYAPYFSSENSIEDDLEDDIEDVEEDLEELEDEEE